MPFKFSGAASTCCGKLYQFYATEFAFKAAAKLEIAAANVFPFRDLLTSLATSIGTAYKHGINLLGCFIGSWRCGIRRH